jgi:hypothetical protein
VNEDGMVAKWNTSAPENKIVKDPVEINHGIPGDD